jgi:CheY-like chemotaxis protein
VDDEQDLLRVISRWLEPDYNVTCLPGGTDSCAAIAALNPDLVIMDIHMPGCNGFKISRQLRDECGFEDLPVIFLTGSKSESDMAKYLHFKGCRYMLKPITGRLLRDAVAEQLGMLMVG